MKKVPGFRPSDNDVVVQLGEELVLNDVTPYTCHHCASLQSRLCVWVMLFVGASVQVLGVI